MLTTLIKYDILFGLKRYGMLFLLLGCTILTGLVISLIGNQALITFFVLLSVLITILLYAAYTITSIQFFYKALSSEESYLNYTIPVSPFQLVFSKMLTVILWGAATAGALVLTWALYLKLFEFEIPPMPDGYWEMMIYITIPSAILSLCVLSFSVALFNTPKFKTFRAGVILVAVAAYLLSQVIGVVQVVLIGVVLYVGDPELLDALFFTGEMAAGQETALFEYMQWPLVISSAIFAVIFFLLTVKLVAKHRSI